MSDKLNKVQVRWQSAALEVLLTTTGKYDLVYGPWIPAWMVVGEICDKAACTYQAANGALKALLTVGLADRSETNEGSFWKATAAASRAADLLLGPFKDELADIVKDDLAGIDERLTGINQALDQILWLQDRRKKLTP